ncbi:GNAT family N-acetyltransferase [Ideonella paludis]|uniref:GNAT family N-acetyltransferase n=1 Tax=Ideonella paludis TaxID=1233411 RepID=UPI0036364DBB
MVGRTWGECAEVEQVWVDEAMRRSGIGRRLMQDFEHAAQARGVRRIYLSTFSFQARGFTRSWAIAWSGKWRASRPRSANS